MVAKVMSQQSLDAVCVDSCRSSLVDIRKKITAACGPSDTMKHDGYAYPGLFSRNSAGSPYEY